MATQAEIDALNQSIINGIDDPVSVSVSGQTVTAHSLADKIALSKHLREISAADASAQQPHRGLRFTQLIPGGGGG